MNLKRITSVPFFASITMGLHKCYTDELINKSTVINCIQDYQEQQINADNIPLSICITECEIVFSGQAEPHLKLNFINYPKFPKEIKVLKIETENITKFLMEKFEQNRIVIEYLNETVMFEKSPEIDPRINIKL